MKLADIISIDKKFQTSVNLEYDLNNIDKVIGYIPTEQSVSIIDRFLRGIYYPGTMRQANVLVGPYGRGKSHLLLVLSALLSLDVTSIDVKKARITLQQLAKKISRVNKETGALVKSIIDNEIRLLPIIINSNGVDINQGLILALREALERANLLDLMPSTHFDAAIKVLKMWENSYPEAYKNFCIQLNKNKRTIIQFTTDLAQYDIESYNLFCEIYGCRGLLYFFAYEEGSRAELRVQAGVCVYLR